MDIILQELDMNGALRGGLFICTISNPNTFRVHDVGVALMIGRCIDRPYVEFYTDQEMNKVISRINVVANILLQTGWREDQTIFFCIMYGEFWLTPLVNAMLSVFKDDTICFWYIYASFR